MRETKHKCPVCESLSCAPFIKTPAQMHDGGAEEFNFDRCAECGYVFLNPPVDEPDLAKYYTEFYLPYRGAKAWGKYAAQVERSDEKLNEKRAALLAKYAAVGEESAVLDIGCGKPDFLRKCVERYACRADGLDFTDKGWRGEAGKYEQVNLTVGAVDDLPDGLKFDFITMWHYLEHDYAPAETLRKLTKKSHEKTVLIIEVPDFESDSRRKFGKYWAGYHTPRHISVFSEKNLRILLEKSGWETVEIKHYGTLDAYVLYWMSRMEQRGIVWSASLEGEFWRFVAGMIRFAPKKLFQKIKPFGIMTAVARPA